MNPSSFPFGGWYLVDPFLVRGGFKVLISSSPADTHSHQAKVVVKSSMPPHQYEHEVLCQGDSFWQGPPSPLNVESMWPGAVPRAFGTRGISYIWHPPLTDHACTHPAPSYLYSLSPPTCTLLAPSYLYALSPLIPVPTQPTHLHTLSPLIPAHIHPPHTCTH